MFTHDKAAEIKRYQQQQQQTRKKLQQEEHLKEINDGNNTAGGGVHFAVDSPKVMSKEFEDVKSPVKTFASPTLQENAGKQKKNAKFTVERPPASPMGKSSPTLRRTNSQDNSNKNNNTTGGKNLFNESINVDTFDRDSDNEGGRKNRDDESNITAAVLEDDDNYRQGGSAYESASSGGGGSSSDIHSKNSASSGGTINRMKQSTIPCGLTNTQLMILLILIPIGFLAGYTLSDVADAVASQRMLSNHKDVIQHVLDVGTGLQFSRRDVSLFLASAPNSAGANTSWNQIVQDKAAVDANFVAVITEMQGSDLYRRDAFLADANKIRQDLEQARTLVAVRAISGNKARNDFLMMIERVYLLNSYIAKDPRGEPLEARLVMFTVVRRIQDSVGFLRACCSAVMSGDVDSVQNLRDIRAMRSSIDRDLMLARLDGRPEVVADVDSWANTAVATHFWDLVDQVEFGDNNSWARMNLTNFLETANALVLMMNAGDAGVLQIIVNGELLEVVAFTAGMKMLGAILSCIIATILVIFYNRREQIRLERLLEATSALADAVQRFVPKNQLRTMGIRSITQVTAGQSTLVAQTVLFSDVVGFSGVACVLPPLELFEWLQNYVGRMSAVIAEEKAYISNFLGDGLMIIASQPTNGLNAGIKMHVAVDKLNLELVSFGSKKPIAIGVGVTHDITCCAVFGDENRLTCTTIGQSVNTASRLEALTRSFGAKILAAQNVMDQVSPDLFRSRCVGKIRVSGSNSFVVAFDVYSADPLPSQDYKDATKQKFEEAVHLTETEPEHAAILFAELMIQAKNLGIKDKALESRKKGTDMDIAVSGATSAQSTPRQGNLSGSPMFFGASTGGLSVNNNPNNSNVGFSQAKPMYLDSNNNNNNNNNNSNINIARNSSFGLLAFEKDGEIKPTEEYLHLGLGNQQQQQQQHMQYNNNNAEVHLFHQQQHPPTRLGGHAEDNFLNSAPNVVSNNTNYFDNSYNNARNRPENRSLDADVPSPVGSASRNTNNQRFQQQNEIKAGPPVDGFCNHTIPPSAAV